MTFTPDKSRARWAGVFLALAVTCLLSLIPMKVPAMNPFWQQEAFTPASTTMADSDDHLGKRLAPGRRAARFGARNTQPTLTTLDPLAPQNGDRPYETKFRLGHAQSLYAGIRANPRIPVKRVRQIALPPPTPFNLRAPPARA
ncbi:hypothetical protein D3C86_558530 [compost metagenome]